MVRGVIAWAFWLGLVWFILEPVPGSWPVGVLAVAVGVGLRLYMGRFDRSGLQAFRLARFSLYFLRASVLGGWDVSRRALTPSLPLSPDVLTYHLSLPSSAARVFLSNALSLLPGTFAADLQGDRLVVHLLAGGPEATLRVRDLEERVADLFETPDR